MEYEDRIRLATPEGIELELELAGVGSRTAARLIDLAIQAVVITAALLLFLGPAEGDSAPAAIATIVAILIGFVIFWGYDTCFEAFNRGQTPGKRLNGLRVVGDRGEPVTFPIAAVRNIMRVVDELLTFFLAGLISILRSPRNQRLGDMAAGTLVVRERRVEPGAGLGPEVLAELDRAAAWDTTAIGDAEVSTVRRFLDRRGQIEPHARDHLAAELAGKLRPRVPGADSATGDERFLELLVAVKERRP